MDTRVFSIVPAPEKTVWTFVIVAAIPLVISLMLLYFAHSCRHTRFELSDSGLRIRGDLYGRMIPRRQLLPERAQVIDFEQSPQFRPKWRTNGAALPGYRSGWFRLRNGEKALLFVGPTDRVVYLPTRDGFSVVLSPDNPEAFVEAVRTWSTS